MVKMNKNMIWIIAAVAAVFLFMNMDKTPDGGDEDIGIDFRVRSGNGLAQAVVGGEYHANAEGQFGVTVGNSKTIPITNLALVSKSDDTGDGGNTFVPATFPFSTVANLGAGASTSQVDTSWFDLEWYATNHPGVTRFTFNFDYDYVDAEGVPQTNVPISGYADIEIIGDRCLGDVLVDTCGAHLLCTYQAGTPGSISLVENQACCEAEGGIWGGSSCTLTCPDGTGPGACVGNLGGYDVATYCNPTTLQLEENCPLCDCYDAHNNPQESCSGTTCVFTDYGAQSVTVNVVGSGSGPVDCTSCDPWVDDTCGNGGCAATEMYQTRTCLPAGCNPTDGYSYSRCNTDPSCSTPPTLQMSYTSGTVWDDSITSSRWLAQSFTTTGAFDLTSVKFRMYGSSPGTVTVRLRTTPTGADLATGTISSGDIGGSAAWEEASISYPLSASTTYWFVLSSSGGTVQLEKHDTWPSGTLHESTNSGGNFAEIWDDLFIEIWGIS